MKNVLITGAGGTLGMACVNEYLANDNHVIAVLSPKKKLPIEQSKNISTYNADLSNEQDTEELIVSIAKNHQSIDIAVLTVGGFAMGGLEDTSLDSVRKMLALNFETAYATARAVFSHMSTSGKSGRIVLIGARPALEPQAGKSMIAYTLSKTLVLKLAELINAEGKNKGIVCSVVIPSVIDTPANRESMPKADFNKWVTPQQIAKTIHYITSSDANPLREPVIKIYGDS